MSSALQTPQVQVNQEEANLITFTPIVEQQVPQAQGVTGSEEQPKDNLIKVKPRKFHIFYLENI